VVFKFNDGSSGLRGEGVGTLQEYFTPTSSGRPMVSKDADDGGVPDPIVPDSFWDDLDDRNSELDRLTLQLFSEFSGLSKDDIVNVFWFDYGTDEKRRARQRAERKGLNLICIYPDDAIMALYKDGQPVAAFYASFRGCYQAGGYVVEGNREYFAHDAFKEEFGGKQNTWHERTNGCADVARDYLLKVRVNYN